MARVIISLIVHDGKKPVYHTTHGVIYEEVPRDQAVGEAMIQLAKKLKREGEYKARKK